MATAGIRTAQIRDNQITRAKLVANFLEGSDLNLTDGNNDATLTGLKPGVNNKDAVNVEQLNAAISAITGVKTLQGPISGAADLTSNTTGNTYADGSNEYKAGDVFQISADGNLTVSDGTIEVKNGDEIVILNDTADAGITLADVFKIDNTESTDILRTGNIEDSLTSNSTSDVLSANQGLVIKALIDAINRRVIGEQVDITLNAQTATLANNPILSTLSVELNGLRLAASQYSVTGGNVVTIAAPLSTEAGDCLIFDYNY